jgi:hypothetical protein
MDPNAPPRATPDRAPRYERNLAIAGLVCVGLGIAAELAQGAHGAKGPLIVEGLLFGLCLRSFVRWRRGTVDHPSFAWFCALFSGAYFLLLVAYLLTVQTESELQAGPVLLCLGLGVLIGIAGVKWLKGVATKRANHEYAEWKRATTLPPPPPMP